MDVSLSLQEVIKFRFVVLLTCSGDVLDDVTLKVTQLLINDEVPRLDGTLLVVGG